MPLPRKEIRTTPSGRFDKRRFAQHIQGLGLEFRWSRAVLCTCRLNTETDQPDPTCGRCNGDGWQYVNPLEAEEPGRMALRDFEKIRAVLSSVALDPSIAQPIGGWTFSDALLTVQQDIHVGYRDRWICTESIMAWTETLIRGADTVPVGKDGRGTAGQQVAMRYEPISVNFVASDDGMGTQTIYYPVTDFNVIPAVDDEITHNYEPGKLVWVSGRGPAVDQQYVIHYECHPVFVVDDETYATQGAVGPARGIKGPRKARQLPTTFKVKLDFVSDGRGT